LLFFTRSTQKPIAHFLIKKYYIFLHPQPSSPFRSVTFGGKNSSVGKSILLNTSQGLSEVLTHSFSGMQKS